MEWFKVSSAIYSDPDLQNLSDKAFRYWMNALAWCSHHETDGIFQFAGKAPKHVQELVDAGRFQPTGDPFSYFLAGWEKWQTSNADREADRASSRERSAKYRERVTRDSHVSHKDRHGEVPILVSSPLLSSRGGGAGGGADFEAWYAAYPLHVGRKKAEENYAKAIREGADPAVLLAAAKAYRDSPYRKPPPYTAYPATWLNQGRWTDDPKAAEPDRMATVTRLEKEMQGETEDSG